MKGERRRRNGRERRKEKEKGEKRWGGKLREEREVEGSNQNLLYYQYLVREDPADYHNDQHYQKVPEDGKL